MEINDVGSGFGVADVFPSFKFLQLITGVRSRLQKLQRESDRILHSIINEHIAAAKAGEGEKEEGVDDLVDVMLKIQQNGELGFTLTTDSVKAILLDMFIAGSETSSTAVEWTMSELKMVIKESLRLHPPLPLLIPRESPERFMDGSSVDYKGNDFEFIQFGVGRRICPGISFGVTNVEIALANLLLHFLIGSSLKG